MAKLIKKVFYTSTGERKINNFFCYLSKEVVKEAGLTGDEQLKVYAKNKKIIIEKGE